MIIFHFQAFVSDYRACLRLRALHPLRTPVFITAAVQKLNLKSPEPGWDNSGAAGEGMTPTVLVSFPWGGVFPTPKTSVWGVQIATRVSKEQDLAGEGAEGQILTHWKIKPELPVPPVGGRVWGQRLRLHQSPAAGSQLRSPVRNEQRVPRAEMIKNHSRLILPIL